MRVDGARQAQNFVTTFFERKDLLLSGCVIGYEEPAC
jgi:hypothetical protein